MRTLVTAILTAGVLGLGGLGASGTFAQEQSQETTPQLPLIDPGMMGSDMMQGGGMMGMMGQMNQMMATCNQMMQAMLPQPMPQAPQQPGENGG